MIIINVKKKNTVEGLENTTSWKVTFDNGVDEAGNPIQIIASVPRDENNRHYQEILKWVEDGNTIEEAD
tara:strand:- start:15 stop:221 length:207 start_codon:yes stop_codon:yes gene_type:complete